MSEDELKKKAIQYLMETLGEPRKPGEIDIHDAAKAFKCSIRAAHARMQILVDKGIYETRITFVDEYKRKMRLWKRIE